MQGWQANPKTHLCEASSIRAMPETEKPPAMRGDIYLLYKILKYVWMIQEVNSGMVCQKNSM